MDGMGFIASMHAASLDRPRAETMLLRPVKCPANVEANRFISAKAKKMVSRGVSFFSSSAYQPSARPKASTSSSPRTSVSDLVSSIRRSRSLRDSQSLRSLSSSSRLPSEDSLPRSRSKSNASGDRARAITIPECHSRNSSNCRRPDISRQSLCSRATSSASSSMETWLSDLVDNDYVAATEWSPLTSPRQSNDPESDLEPSRASSMLDHELASPVDEAVSAAPTPPLPILILSESLPEPAQGCSSVESFHRGLQPASSPQTASERCPIMYSHHHRHGQNS